MSEIKELWDEIPKGAVKLEYNFLSNIPFHPKCIERTKLQEYLGITKATLSYHVRKHKNSLIIFVLKRKHYYQRRDEP